MSDSLNTLPKNSFAFKEINPDQGLFANEQKDGSIILGENKKAFFLKSQTHKEWFLQPNTGITPGLFNSNPILFRLPRNMFSSKVDFVLLEIGVQEGGGVSSVTPVVASQLINRCEQGNDSVSPIQIWYGEQIYQSFQYYTREQLQLLAAFGNLNMDYQTFGNENAIPPSGTALYSIPLPISILNDINPSAMSTDILLNIYMNTLPVVSGSGALWLSSLNIRFISTRNDYTDMKVLKSLSEYPMIINYDNAFPYTSPSTVCTAGQQITLPLSGISCYCGYVTISIRSSLAFAGGAYRNYVQIGGTNENTGSLDILDASGNSILGSPGPYPSYFRGPMAAYHTKGYMSAVVPLYNVYFCEDPALFMGSGTLDDGYYQFDTTQQLRITFGPTFTTGTYIITAMFNGFKSVVQAKGLLSVTQ